MSNSDDEDRPSISITSHGQSGGITAYKVIITNIPEAQIHVEEMKLNQPQGDNYVSLFLLKIKTRVPINNLYVRVDAEAIQEIDMVPQRGGVSFGGHSGKREGWAFTNVQQAYGDYHLSVVTTRPGKPLVSLEET